MPRPRSISTEQLLEAAREVFFECGYSATTAQIAQRAGISEGTLFKRFASKEALFEEAIGLSDVPRWWTTLATLGGQGEVRANLEHICLKFVEIARQVMPRLMMVWSRGNHPPPRPPHDQDPMERALEALATYLRAETALGRLRALDESVVARAVMGALFSYVIRELHAPPGTTPSDDARFVGGLIDAFWNGIRPTDEPVPGTRGASPRVDQKVDAP